MTSLTDNFNKESSVSFFALNQKALDLITLGSQHYYVFIGVCSQFNLFAPAYQPKLWFVYPFTNYPISISRDFSLPIILRIYMSSVRV